MLTTLRITPAMIGHIAAIDEFKGAWHVFTTFPPERLSALRRVASFESIGSSTRIESAHPFDREAEGVLVALSRAGPAGLDGPNAAGTITIP